MTPDAVLANVALGVALGVALALVAGILVWALVKVSGREPSSMVTITLGLLTLVSIGAFVVTNSEILGTIAATGVGALAGAVSNLFDRTGRIQSSEMPKGEPQKETPPGDTEKGPVD